MPENEDDRQVQVFLDVISSLHPDPERDAREFRVEPGEIRVHEPVTVVVSAEDFLVAEVDCATKYPAYAGYGADPDGQGLAVFFRVGEDTLRPDESMLGVQTEIILPSRCRGWQVMADAARYTIRIAAWRDRRETERGNDSDGDSDNE
jgi:hypothetical protein